MAVIVKICDLDVRFRTYEGVVLALNGVNLTIFEGETLGLIVRTAHDFLREHALAAAY